jgi:hypothetical protein
MKDSNAILQFVLQRTAQIYERPLMYGGTPECVDALLHFYHELVAEILEIRQGCEEVNEQRRKELNCVGMGFSALYRSKDCGAPDHEVARFVVENWREIDSRLGLRVPSVNAG